MTKEESQQDYNERLENLILFAKSGKKDQIKVNLHKEIIKQVTQSEETDDLKVEKDLYLLIGDFTLAGAQGKRHDVTKVYAFGNIDETEIEEKVIRNIANERLKMDYQRLRNMEIEYHEEFF
ncbi:hypothetical protein ACFL7M_00315 [Thermodesulfobacteriota bacterium]